ncbi:MAG: ATP-dependent DNA helicase [Kocuria sp.]|nr:ATP-dependent DNA helicase [Kocuria sp.]
MNDPTSDGVGPVMGGGSTFAALLHAAPSDSRATGEGFGDTTLLPPVHALDQQQRIIADLQAGCGPVMVWGAPGTGRTTAVVALARQRLEAGLSSENLLILTPSRLTAARARSMLSASSRVTMSASPVRAWQAYAFDVLRRAHLRGLLPGVHTPPKLLSGPEQDVMLRELMEGHAQGLGAAVVWPPQLREAVATRGFRAEVREFFDRLSEHDITPNQLRSLADALNRPEWVAVAQLRQEYQAVRRLRMPEAFDPSALVTEAARVLEVNPEFLAEEQQRLDLVVVDDLQEATQSIHRLLGVLCAGKDVVITACPDTVVQGFRGARPDALRQVPQMVGQGRPVTTVVLRENHRMNAAVQCAWQRVAHCIPAVAARDVREAHPAPVQTDSPVQGVLLASATHEARWIGADILRRHLLDGTPLDDMAVVVRNSAMLRSLRRHLEALGIAVSTSAMETPVRDEPAVKPLLAALHLVVSAERQVNVQGDQYGDTGEHEHQVGVDFLEASEAVELLTSRIGGATPMDIRRLRQRLRYAELRVGGGRNSDRLVVEALTTPGLLDIAEVRSTPARRIARMVQAGRTAVQQPNATAQTVLWALWEAAGVATVWQREALNGGEPGRRADRDLDAVVALFDMAQRFVDHLPGAGAGEFLDFLDLQELPMDTLAARAPSHATVEIMTPATAAGRQWPVVYVAGVQQNHWPNTTLRGQLLNTDLLNDAVEIGVEVAARTSPVARRHVVRHDELRSFSTAVSRAAQCLVVTAVSDQDNEPSEFLGLIDPWEYPFHPEASKQARPVLSAPRPLTLRALTAQLRTAAQTKDPAGAAPARAEAAARILHHFTQVAPTVPGAAPHHWWGMLRVSSTEPVVDPAVPVPVSPSRVETIHRSPLDWWVSMARAEHSTDPARSLGTLVHEIAENTPDAPSSELLRDLHERWPQLGLPDTWEAAQLKQRAETMLRKFADYVLKARKEGRELVAVEGAFTVVITGGAREALLRGRVDRLELDDQGRYVVVDLKTGKTAPRRDDLPLHPQLGAYQVALAAGAGEAMIAATHADSQEAPLRIDQKQPAVAHSGGAVLVQLGTNTVNVSVQSQEAMDEQDTWARELITAAAQLISGERFMARHSSQTHSTHGPTCKLPGVCPLCSAGRQVTE